MELTNMNKHIITINFTLTHNIKNWVEELVEEDGMTPKDAKETIAKDMEQPCGETKVELLIGYDRSKNERYYRTIDLTGLTVKDAVKRILKVYKGDSVGDYQWIEYFYTNKEDGKRYAGYGS